MANGIHFSPLPAALTSVMAHVNPTLEELAEGPPKLLTVDQASLLANVQDDMAALLASVLRRQTGRRVDKMDDAQGPEPGDTPTDDIRQEEVQKIRALLQTAGASWGAGYDMARALFPDPAELALLLASLRDDTALDEEIRAEIEQTLAELTREHGADRLAAGKNIGRVVATFATRTGLSADSLKAAYRALLASGSGEALTYRYLIDAFGFARRGLALDFLEQALAADIAADTPSRPADDFQPLLAVLFQLRLLRSADALLLSTAGRPARRSPRARTDDPAPDLLDSVLVDVLLATLCDLGEAQREFDQFLAHWRGVADDVQVFQWTGRLLRAMAEVPVELFPDLAYREALLTTLADTVQARFHHVLGASMATWGKYV